MTTAQLRRVHGALVHPIAANTVVEHTVRHFFDPAEYWSEVPPRTSPSPAQFIEGAGLEYARLPSLSRSRHNAGLQGANLKRWSEDESLRVLALRAHAEGYYPRYALLLERAGRITSGSWVRDRDGYRVDIKGYRVAVHLSPRGDDVLVKTAFRSPVLASGTQTYGGPTNRPFGELLKAYCQPRPDDASQSGRTT